ncbi:TorF family putative porin [Viscerimonas tarda]
MKSRKIVLGLLFLGLGLSSKTVAQVEVSASADLVSSYVWRGSKGSGASIQPALSASAGGFTLGAWGSTAFTDLSAVGLGGYKEADFYASYSVGGLGLTVTDYWWDGDGSKYFTNPEEGSGHLLEATLAYTLPESFPLSLSWNTFVLGKGNKKADGKNSFSTYIEASYPFSLGGADLTASVGGVPWESAVYGVADAKIVNVALGASKEIKITDSFSVPAFAQIIVNPASEDINFVVGITIK